MGFCMVGYGSIARYHMHGLLLESARPHTVVGRLEAPTADFAREYGFARHTTDLDEALAAEDVDAVVVASPTDLHAEQVEKCLLAGKHVLCEVPLATSLADADRLIALADERDLRLMVSHTQRYVPAFALAHELVSTSKIRVHHIVHRSLAMRRENVNWKNRRRSWADNLLWHHACHLVDTALWILGTDDVEVDGHLGLPTKALGITMDLSISMRTRLDQLVTIVMSYNSHIVEGECVIVGEEDTLRVAKGCLSTHDRVLYEPPAGKDGLLQATADLDREFVAAIREAREPAVSGRVVRPALAVLQRVQDQFAAWAPPGAMHPIG